LGLDGHGNVAAVYVRARAAIEKAAARNLRFWRQPVLAKFPKCKQNLLRGGNFLLHFLLAFFPAGVQSAQKKLSVALDR
jgi:hypothetical protein